MQITQKQDFMTCHKCFRDFETEAKFSKSNVFQGNILYPYKLLPTLATGPLPLSRKLYLCTWYHKNMLWNLHKIELSVSALTSQWNFHTPPNLLLYAFSYSISIHVRCLYYVRPCENVYLRISAIPEPTSNALAPSSKWSFSISSACACMWGALIVTP